jgi:magnesium chelatase subunit D
VSERSEPRPARGASASEPVGDGVWGRSPHEDADVSERSEPRPARGASASEPVGDGVWGRSPHEDADVSERSEPRPARGASASEPVGEQRAAFPFSAVVGVDDAKLALLLAAVEPAIGGVLLRGDKGSAKTTLARGLAGLRDGAPFVDLPLGATEERVVGSLDLAAALTGGEVRFQPGLLAAAHGGVLYVDEVNLLADHLVDVLLDVAATGVNRVERDAISHTHAARFVLVGSMNPEEGDLRPQLLDRFGLAVDVRTSADPDERADAVSRRVAFDAGPEAFVAAWAEEEAGLRERLRTASPAPLEPDTLRAASRVCVAAGAESLRADLVLARAAAALAGWHRRQEVTTADLRTVAPLVLAHRARRQPLDPLGAPPPGLDDLLDQVLGPADPAPHGERRHRDDHEADGADGDHDGDRDGGGPDSPPPASVAGPGPITPIATLRAPRAEQPTATGRRSPVDADRGRTVGAEAARGSPRSVAPVATLSAAAARWATDPDADRRIEPSDLRQPRREARTGNLLVLAVDASGSMGADRRMAAVKGALLGLLVDAYQRRDRVALVTFGGAGARVVLRPTGSVEVARSRLEDLPTGGETPLADGITAAVDLAARAASPTLRPILVVVTDGRATAGPEPFPAALAAAAVVARRRLPAVVVDVEPAGHARLGLAGRLAAAMDARHLPLSDLRAEGLEAALRTL